MVIQPPKKVALALAKLLRELAALHSFNLPLARDSPDADAVNAERTRCVWALVA